MKILFLARSLDYGGAERQLVVLAKGLAARGHDVIVAVFYSGGPLEKDLRNSGVVVRSLNKRSRWDVVPFVMTLLQVVRSERPDIIHGYLCEPNIFSLLPKLFLRRLKVVWGIRSSYVDSNKYDWVGTINSKLACWLSRFADCIIANSQAGYEYHVSEGYPNKTMVVIHNGIDTDRFCRDMQRRQRIRTEWGVTKADKVIGYVARLDPMKDHPTFLGMAASLVQERENVTFVCVGNGRPEYRESLLGLADRLGLKDHILWLSARQDVESVFNGLDIAVNSSQFGEGFSNVVAEAMACGVPCVVTDVGDSAFIVGDKGKVVPPNNPDALKSAIVDLLDHPRFRPDEIRQHVVVHVSVPRLVGATEEVLCKAVTSA